MNKTRYIFSRMVSKMIQSLRFAVILLVLCLCISAAPASNNAAAASSNAFVLTADDHAYLDSIRDKPITVGISSGLMSFMDSDGSSAGMLLPVINLLENGFGLTVIVSKVAWGKSFELLDDGTIDMFGLAISSETRREKYLATESLFVSGLDIYSRTADPLGSLMNLANKDIACVENSVLPQILLKYITPSTTIKYYSEIDAMLTALENDEVDCVFTAQSVQAELLHHPDIQYETRVTSVKTPQCLYSGNQELAGLVDIINRYISSDLGGQLLADISESRGKSILQAARMQFSKDIDYIRKNYENLRVYDSGVLYPLSYSDDGVYKGLQQDINDVFRQLTGMTIEVRSPSDFENGLVTAIGMMRSGELVAATGTQLSNVYSRNAEFEFSQPIMTDTLRVYSIGGNRKELAELKIGTTSSAMSYVDWSTLVDRQPIVYASNDLLSGALKRGEIDAVFFGEMNADYYYSVQKDYTLERVGDISVDTAYYIMMSRKNEVFNKLYNESVKLQRTLHPDGGEMWKNATIEDKFAFMRLQSRISEYQNTAITAGIVLLLALVVFMYVLWYQYKKFSNYDKQITLMLTTQKNADMIWGNIATGKLISKGNYPIYRNWDLDNYPCMPLNEAFISEGFLDDVKNDMKEIDEHGLAYSVAEKTFSSHLKNDEYFMRRYTHILNENEFMALVLDVTDEKQREAELSELANTDPLSKLKNRRSMQEILYHRVSRYSPNVGRLFIVMFDVDNFKNVNDTYGHEIGDNVLVGIAKTFKEVAPACVASRWGGEEFLIILESETLEEAVETVECIREEISNKVFPVGTRTSFSVTISCGISELLSHGDVQSAVAMADEAMYSAKNGGKNCVKVKLK